MTGPGEGVVRLRMALLCVLGAWMLFGPFYRQILDGENQHLREFRMYGTRAVRTCQVFFEQERGGEWTPVSRWELEGFSFDRFPARGQRMLDKRRDAERAGQRLCGQLGGDAGLRYRRRCGHVRRGWSAWEISDDLCGGRR